MKFCWCSITVNNLDESVKFYQEVVGLSVNQRFAAGPDIEIAFLGDGETKIELICGLDHKAPGNVKGISLGFEVESLDKMIDFVKEKGIHAGSTHQPNPNVKYFFVKDPNGVSIQFVENM